MNEPAGGSVTARPEVSLERKVDFLRRPNAYPQPCARVQTIETHLSWVFLTERDAYKLKKPVEHDGADLRTCDARLHNCEDEVRLNRRLAAHVYLGVVPLGLDERGGLRLGARAPPVDWLVRMRRLPQRAMLDHALRTRQVATADILRVARCLARFHRAAAPETIALPEFVAALERQIALDRHSLCDTAYRLDAASNARLCDAQLRVLQTRQALFAARIAAGKIVEGHGDLRPEHVCLRPQVMVIDCLEFSRALRVADALDEIAFLALEVERVGDARQAAALLDAYCDAAGDQPDRALIHFYKSLRAAIRARLAIRHLDDPRLRDDGRWRERAQAYLRLAWRHQDAINSLSEPPP